MFDRSNMARALIRNHDLHARLRAMLATRAIGLPYDGANQAELLLEGEWERETRAPLGDMYREPLADGGGAWMLDAARDRLREYLNWYYTQSDNGRRVIGAMQDTQSAYMRRAANLGGQMALDALGLDEADDFDLTHDGLLEFIRTRAANMLDPDGDMSITATTREELVDYLDRAEDGLSWEEVYAGISAWVLARTAVRTHAIAATESVRMSRWGLALGYIGNGVKEVIHRCEPDVLEKCTSFVCPPLCSKHFRLGSLFDPMAAIPGSVRIPLHPHCRCFYEPERDGWLKPAVIWTGFLVNALED